MSQRCSSRDCVYTMQGQPADPFSHNFIKIEPHNMLTIRDNKGKCHCFDIRTLYVELQRQGSPWVIPYVEKPLDPETFDLINRWIKEQTLPPLKPGRYPRGGLSDDDINRINAWARLSRLVTLPLISATLRPVPLYPIAPQLPSGVSPMNLSQLNALINTINGDYQAGGFGSTSKALKRLYKNTKDRVISAQDEQIALSRLDENIFDRPLFEEILYSRVYDKDMLPVPAFRPDIRGRLLEYGIALPESLFFAE